MISCILLCAGLSERFSSIKALAHIGPERIIERVQKTLLNSNAAEIIIVLGAHKEKIEPFISKNPKLKTVFNENYLLGQTSSFHKGLSALSKNSLGTMLLPVDCPFVTESTINSLINQFSEKQPSILIPTFNGRKGHPPIFHKKLIHEIQSLETDKGLNTVIQRHQKDELLTAVNDSGVVDTFNTPQELQTLLEKHNLT